MLHNTAIAYPRLFGQDTTTDRVPRSRMSFGGDRRGGFQSPVPMDIDTPPSTPYSRHHTNAPSCDFVTFGTFGWPAGFSFEPSSLYDAPTTATRGLGLTATNSAIFTNSSSTSVIRNGGPGFPASWGNVEMRSFPSDLSATSTLVSNHSMEELRSTSQSPFSGQHIWSPMDAQVATLFPTSRTSNTPPAKLVTSSKRPRSSVGRDQRHWANSTGKSSTNNRTQYKPEARTQVNRPKYIFGGSSDSKAPSRQASGFSFGTKAPGPSPRGFVHSMIQRSNDAHPKRSSKPLASRTLVDVTQRSQSSTIYQATPMSSHPGPRALSGCLAPPRGTPRCRGAR